MNSPGLSQTAKHFAHHWSVGPSCCVREGALVNPSKSTAWDQFSEDSISGPCRAQPKQAPKCSGEQFLNRRFSGSVATATKVASWGKMCAITRRSEMIGCNLSLNYKAADSAEVFEMDRNRLKLGIN